MGGEERGKIKDETKASGLDTGVEKRAKIHWDIEQIIALNGCKVVRCFIEDTLEYLLCRNWHKIDSGLVFILKC